MRHLLRRVLGYNAISALQIVLVVTFQVLLARRFGASSATDAYLISLLGINFISTLASSIAEMFTQYFHEIKMESPREATAFYLAALNFTLMTGAACSLLAIGLADPLVHLIAPGFRDDQLATLRAIFQVLAIGVTAAAAMRLNVTLLRAEMRFLPIYVLGLLTPGLNVVAVLVGGGDGYGIEGIAWAFVLGAWTGFVCQEVYIARVLGIRWAPRLWHSRLRALLGHSLVLRVGHQIWDLKDLVATYALSTFPTGTLTLYLYGSRVAALIFAVTSSAWMEMLYSLTSKLVQERNVNGLRSLVRRNFLVFTGLCGTALLVVAVLLPSLLTWLVSARLSGPERETIHGVFLILIPFYLIQSVESPWVALAVAMKQGGKVFAIGLAFISIFALLSLGFRPWLGIYGVPVALALAQLHNLGWYWTNGRRLFRQAELGSVRKLGSVEPSAGP